MHTLTHTLTLCDGSLLLKGGADEEGVRLGVFVLSDLHADLWDAHTDLIQEPQQSVVVDRVYGERILFFQFFQLEKTSARSPNSKTNTAALLRGHPSVC